MNVYNNIKTIFVPLYSLFLVFTLVSCSKNKEINDIEFAKKRTVAIPVQYKGSRSKNIIAYDKSNNTEYIVSMYIEDCMLFFYDINTSKLCKSFKMPYSIVPKDIYYLNKDSIFITGYSSNTIVLINDKGELINKWDVYKDSSYIFLGGISCINIYADNNDVIVIGSSSRSSLLEGHHIKSPCIFKFSFQTKRPNLSLVKSIPYSPRFTTDTVWYADGTSFAIKDRKIYVSFSIEHNIFCYDGDKMQSIPAKSQYLNKFLPFERKRAFSIPYIDSMYIVMPYYEGITYDKYRDLFYRKAIHQIPISFDGKKINRNEDKPFSIVTFDGNMQKINEILMPANTYLSYKTYISKEGIIFQHINNTPDSLKFDIYSVKVNYKGNK